MNQLIAEIPVKEDLDESFLWLEENLPKEYEGKDLERAFDCLSRADVFKGRIRRWQHWRFLVYINDLMTAGIALSKDEKYKKVISYTPQKRSKPVEKGQVKMVDYAKGFGFIISEEDDELYFNFSDIHPKFKSSRTVGTANN